MEIAAPFHVLLIEDSPDDRADIRQMLLRGSQRHYTFSEAETGSAALHALREMANPPDCILLDFNLPDMNALDILAEMHPGRSLPGCPVVVLTGVAECGPQVIGAGAQDYVGKSWASPESLTRAIENAVERYALSRERLVADEELRESEERLRVARDAAFAISFEWDIVRDEVRRYFSRDPLLSATPPEAPSTFGALCETVAAEDRAVFMANVHAALEEPDGRYENEYRIIHPNGGVAWLYERGQVKRDNSGRAVKLIGLSQDISVRKRRELGFAFLVELQKALAPLETPAEIMSTAAARIANYFGFQHCLMIEIDEAGDSATVLHDHFPAGDAPSLVGVYRISDFHTEEERRWMAAGHPLLVSDMSAAPRSEEKARRFAELGIGSAVNVPYVSEEGWKFLLGGQRSSPYPWPTEDSELLTELAARVYLRLERAHTDGLLRASEELNRTILNSSPDCVKVIGDDGSVIHLNEAGMCLLEISDITEIVGHPWIHMWPEAGRQVVQAALEAAQSGSPAQFEQFSPTAKGTPKWWDVRVSPMRAADGSIPTVLAVSRDITERRQRESELEEIAQRLDLGMNVAGVALCHINYISGINHLSAEIARLFGLGDKALDVPREIIHSTFHPDDRAELTARIAASLDPLGDGWFASDHRIVWPDGDVRWLRVRKQVFFEIRHGESFPVRGILAAIDVTDMKRAEISLAEVARRKDEFLAMLSHELRNPLAAIRHAVQMARESTEDPDASRWSAEVIDRQSAQLHRMVEDLLDVARINRGRIELRPEPLDLRTVIEGAVAANHFAIEQQNHSLSITIHDPLRVSGDAARLEQVFVNLLNNAAKYTPEGGCIRLDAHSKDGVAIITITDNGVGITSELLPHVFDLFRQANSIHDPAQGGLGIGLSVVKSLVEMHSGRITVESRAGTVGTTVTVRLPLLIESEAMPVAAPAISALLLPALRVLIVDDHLDAALTLAQLLQRRGCEVRYAHSGPDGLTTALEFLPTVLLLDLGLPGFDGYELSRRLRAEAAFSNAHLIAISGYAQEEDRARCKTAGFDEHFAKPLNFKKLIEVIHSRLMM